MVRLRFCFLALFLLIAGSGFAQQSDLTVQQIMQNPRTWVGVSPSGTYWSEDGQTLYFRWDETRSFASDSLYKLSKNGGSPVKVSPEERRAMGDATRFFGWHHDTRIYSANLGQKIYASGGDLFLYNRNTGASQQLTDTRAAETNPRFTRDDQGIYYMEDNNVFHRDLASGNVRQLTDIREGNPPPSPRRPDEQDQWLRDQQVELFDVVRKWQAQREAREAAQAIEAQYRTAPPTFYRRSKFMMGLNIDPNGRFVTFGLGTSPFAGNRNKRTIVQNYVTESGYAEDLNARAKVGVGTTQSDYYIMDLARDTTLKINLHSIEGAYDVPEYQRAQGVQVDSTKTKRVLFAQGPFWSGDGQYAILVVRAYDNKDRWIVQLDPETGHLTTLDRQHDEAWVAGPGIGWFGGAGSVGWLPDNRRFYFQSERSGYSHLYTVDCSRGGQVRQLTDGDFEVFSPQISKDGQWWYFTSSEGSPFERHFYRMPLDGGTRTRLTTMAGNNAVAFSPDEDQMAILHSYSNRPPELFMQAPSGTATQKTHSTTDAWRAYPWRDPQIIHLEASDGVQVPARLYEPENHNGAAVLFVHGAGYLQNVHKWWSSYFREYMFHNLLTDLGYVVLDVDYRASSGYGRDWRTAIYRHMGGRDLQDYVDASQYVARTYNVDPERIAIYGGSYGGFITLMALFTEPEHFGAGAALRSVTDWAHYNHTYTANILNTPTTDSLAFARSSPINFAEGLEDPLLIPHGAIDTNVQYQDVVRLAQRLIELGKTDWEMAIYPVEGHGFQDPASWTDEYRRILKIIEESVGPNRIRK